jgi:hypothetical protein
MPDKHVDTYLLNFLSCVAHIFQCLWIRFTTEKSLFDPDCHVGLFSHAALGSLGVVDQLTQAAILLHLGSMIKKVGTVSHRRGVPPWWRGLNWR